MSEFEKLITERNFFKDMLGEVGKTRKKLMIVPKVSLVPSHRSASPCSTTGREGKNAQTRQNKDHLSYPSCDMSPTSAWSGDAWQWPMETNNVIPETIMLAIFLKLRGLVISWLVPWI